MKICFISKADNYHTIKWATWFCNRGYEVHVVSFVKADIPNVTVHYIDTGIRDTDPDRTKIKYLFQARKIKRIVDEIKPDVVNVHFASSYGAVTALSGIKDYVLSVWGSDVYDFPRKSIFHKMLLKFSLLRASHIFSTSAAMAKETQKYTNKKIEITPFGVDTDLFNPNKRTRLSDDNRYIIGTVKTLAHKYGIEYMLKGIQYVVKNRPDIPLAVRIAGKGPFEKEYQLLAKEFGIENFITWLGFISQVQAATEWANMDVGIIPSILESESFGVSAVEAEASATALIISDIPGLMEATIPMITSLVVPKKDEISLGKAIIELYDNKEKRKQLAENGFRYSREKYELNECFRIPEALFKQYMAKNT